MNSPSNGFKNEPDQLDNPSSSLLDKDSSEQKKGPFLRSEELLSLGLGSEVSILSDSFLNPLLGEFIF